MSAHPPIPPNCKYFDTKGGTAFEMWDEDSCGCMVLLDWPHDHHMARQFHNELEHWRPIIAAVARCAWIDEATRLDKTEYWEDAIMARQNAEAWRAWGEGK